MVVYFCTWLMCTPNVCVITHLSRLTDTVTNLCDLVERSIGAKREVGAGHVVADRGRNHHQRQTELGELCARFVQLQAGLVRLATL